MFNNNKERSIKIPQVNKESLSEHVAKNKPTIDNMLSLLEADMPKIDDEILNMMDVDSGLFILDDDKEMEKLLKEVEGEEKGKYKYEKDIDNIINQKEEQDEAPSASMICNNEKNPLEEKFPIIFCLLTEDDHLKKRKKSININKSSKKLRDNK